MAIDASDRLTRRRSITGLLAAGLAILATKAWAAAFPAKPIQFVVPFTPGGGADVLARMTAANVSAQFGQQVVVENRAGAGGNIAAQIVAKARPDGYMLLEGNLAHVIAMTLYRAPTYDIIKDFAPVTMLGSVPFVLVVSAQLPIRSVEEFIAAAKAKPGGLTYGSSGIGGPSHLAMELFRSMTGLQLVHVPYKGAAPTVEDLMAGRIDAAFLTVSAVQPAMAGGQVRGLGVSSLRRAASVPDLPTIAEAGVPGYEATTWFGVMAPARTPPDIITVLHDAFAAALAVPASRDRLAGEGFQLASSTPEEFTAYIGAETRKWAPVVAASGAVVN